MDRKTLVILLLVAVIAVAVVLAYGRYNYLQEEMRELRDQRQEADGKAQESAVALEDAQKRHRSQQEEWEERLESALQDVSRLQDVISHSEERERLLRGEAHALRGALDESKALVLASTDDELVAQIPQKSHDAYGRVVELGKIEGSDAFWTGRPGIEVWGLSLEETLSLRDQLIVEEGVSTERGLQITSLEAQVVAQEEVGRVWMERTRSTEGILEAAIRAKDDVSDQLKVADRQIDTLEGMVYFSWMPELGVGVTCGAGMIHGQAECVAGLSANWRLRFR